MNNNNSNNRNNNNNRRRGRGNSNRPQGGGQQLNRIDSRARGNAPQMHEKYRKLASDAHLNGDRVQAEYYLQFADHYFRVIADTRVRQDEQRGGRRDENSGEGGNFDQGEDGDYGNEGDMPGFDQPMNYRREEPREAREPREQRPPREPRPDEGNREARVYEQRGPQRPRDEEARPVAHPANETGAEGGSDFAPAAANPFTRNTRGLRPRRDREERPTAEQFEESVEALGLDPSILPPAIAESRAAVIADAGVEAPAPRRRGRPRKVPLADGGEPFEVVGS